jgi:hypothetical protein
MQLKFTPSLLVLALSMSAGCLLISSCKKSGGSSAAASNTVSVSIGKTSYNAVTSVTSAADANSKFTLVYTQILSGDTIWLTMEFPDTLTLNKPYTADGGTIYLNFIDANKNGTSMYEPALYQNSGTLTLTSLNTTTHVVTGTFTGTEIYNDSNSSDSLLVSSGKFNATYNPL